MFWFYLIFSALISKAEYDRFATAQGARPTDQGLSRQTDGQMTSLLDALTIYRAVASLSPSDPALLKCCDSVTMTPHLDLLVVFTRHVTAWVKYASASLYKFITDSTVVPPCLPEAKLPDMTLPGQGGDGPSPSPPSPPLPLEPLQTLRPVSKEQPVRTSQTLYGSTTPSKDMTLPGQGGDGPSPSPPSPPLPLEPLQTLRPVSKEQPARTSQSLYGSTTPSKEPPPTEPTLSETASVERRGTRDTEAIRRKRRKRRRRRRQWRKRRATRKPRAKRKAERSVWRPEVTALGAVMSETPELGPALWLLAGTALGLGIAVIWNVVHRSNNDARCQHTGDLAHDIVHAIVDFFQDAERPATREDDRIIAFNEPAQNRNDSLAKRMRRMRRRLRRRRKRRRGRRRRRHRHHDSSGTDSQTAERSSESTSMTPVELFSADTMMQPFAADDSPDRGASETFFRRSNLKRSRKHGERKLKSERRRKREAERMGSTSMGHSQDKRNSPELESQSWRLAYDSSNHPSSQEVTTTSESATMCSSGEFGRHVVDNVMPDRATWNDSDEYSEAHSVSRMRSASLSTSSSLREEFTGPWVSTSLTFVVYDLDVIDDIPDEVLEVLSCDSKPCHVHPHDRYHYVGSKIIVQRLPLPTGTSEQTASCTYLPSVQIHANSTVTSQPDPTHPAGPESSKKRVRIADSGKKKTSVHGQNSRPPDTIENNDDKKPPQSPPTDREKTKIVHSAPNQEVTDIKSPPDPTLEDNNETGIVHSAFNLEITDINPVPDFMVEDNNETEIVRSVVISEVMQIMPPAARDEKHFVSSATNTEATNITDSSVQTVPEPTPTTTSMAVNTELVDTADFSIQTSFKSEGVNTGMNTEKVDTAESSQQTPHKETVNATVNTDILDVMDSSVQTAFKKNLVSAAINTEYVDMIDNSQQTCLVRAKDLVTAAVNTEPRDMTHASLQVSLPRAKLVSSAVNTDPDEASLMVEKITRDATSQTDLGFLEDQQHQDVSTQTSELELDVLQTPENTPHEDHPMFPQNLKTPKVCAPAAKAASADFQGSDVRNAMAYVKETYEECLINPSGETYYSKYSPPERVSRKSPIRSRRNTLGTNKMSATSPVIDHDGQNHIPEKEQSPNRSIMDSTYSMGDSVAIVMNTIKEVYDYCMKDASAKPLGSSIDSPEYQQGSKDNQVQMSKSEEHISGEREKLKQTSKTRKELDNLISVSQKPEPWARSLQSGRGTLENGIKEKHTKRSSCKPKPSVTPRHQAIDKSHAMTQESVKTTSRASEDPGKTATIRVRISQRQREPRQTLQHVTVTSSKTSVGEDQQQSGSSGVQSTKNVSESLSYEKRIGKELGLGMGEAEAVPGNVDLFRELKEKVAKRELSQDDPVMTSAKSVHRSGSDAAISETGQSQKTQTKPTTLREGKSEKNIPSTRISPRVNKSDLVSPAVDSETKSTQKICNTQTSKTDFKTPQNISGTANQKMEKESPKTESKKIHGTVGQRKEESTSLAQTGLPPSTQKICNLPKCKESAAALQNVHRPSEQKDDRELSDKEIRKETLQSPQKSETIPRDGAESKNPETLCGESEQKIYITSHAREGKHATSKVCITLQDKENAQPRHKVCIVSQQKSEAVSSQKTLSPQNISVLSPPKICVTSQQKGGSPQRVCVTAFPNDDQQAVEKLCITPSHTPGIESPPKVCIIPRQKRTTQSPTRESFSGPEKLSPPRQVITFTSQENLPSNDFQNDLQERRKLQTTSGMGQLTENPGTQNAMEYFQKVCPPCFTHTYKTSVTKTKDRHENKESHHYSPTEISNQLSKKESWGNVEQVFERQRKRSAAANNNQGASVMTVPKNIRQVYDRCMTGKFKPKKAHQTQIKGTIQRSGDDHSNEIAAVTTTLERGVLNEKQADSHNSKHERSATPSRDKQSSILQEVSLSSQENNLYSEAGDGGPIAMLPLVFPFVSQSSGPGTPPPSDQDSSNSAERVSSETLNKEQAQWSTSCVDKKKPYQSLSKVSIKEPSPPWEVSDRAKNNVFSPVGWTSPRPGITSLFRAYSNEKMDQFDHDGDKATHLQARTSKENAVEKLTQTLHTENRMSKASTWTTVPQSAHGEYQNGTQGVSDPLSKKTVNTRLRSSVKNDGVVCGHNEVIKDKHYCTNHPDMVNTRLRSSVKNDGAVCGHNEVSKDKHYCSIHPDMVELSKAKSHITEHKLKDSKQGGPVAVDHRPRIMSKPRFQKQKSFVPKLLGISTNPLPSRLHKPQRVTNQLEQEDSIEEIYKNVVETRSSHGSMETCGETDDVHPCVETNETLTPNDSKGTANLFQQHGRNSTGRLNGDNSIASSHPSDLTLVHNVAGKYRLCSCTNDINAELKDKLSDTLRPSQIKRGKRKSESHSAAACENVRTTISTKSGDELGSQFLSSKPRSRLPVTSVSQPPRTEEITGAPTNINLAGHKHMKTSNDASNIVNDQSKLIKEPRAIDKSILHPALQNKMKASVNDRMLFKSTTVEGASAKGSTTTVSVDGQEPNGVQTNMKLSRIPVSTKPNYENGVQRYSVVTPESEHVKSSYREAKAIPENSYLPWNDSSRGSEKLEAASSQKADKRSTKPEATEELMQRKGSCSRLPVPRVSSSSKCFLSEMHHNIETKPVSPLIAERIKRLQTSVLEQQAVKPREIRHIRKLTTYLENEEEERVESKRDRAKSTGKEEETDLPKNCAAVQKQSETVDHNSDQTVGFRPDGAENMGNTGENVKLLQGQSSHMITRTEGNISQNHNWMDVSFESLYSSQNVDEDTSFSFCSGYSGTSDLSVIEITENIEEKTIKAPPDSVTPPTYSTVSEATVLACRVQKELNDLAHQGALYPSQIRHRNLTAKSLKNHPGMSKGSSLFSSGLVGDDCEQIAKTKDDDGVDNAPARATAAGKHALLPRKSSSTSTCHAVRQVNTINGLSSFSCCDYLANSRSSYKRGRYHWRTRLNRSVSHGPQRPASVFDFINFTTEPLKCSVLNSCSQSGDSNLTGTGDMIGPPQANSSFMDEFDSTIEASPIPDSGMVQTHEFASECVHGDQDCSSIIPKPSGMVSVGDKGGDQLSMRSSTPSRLTWAQERCMSEMSSASEEPIAGSTDVMCKAWKPVLKQNCWAESSARDSTSHRSPDEEMLHLMDISREPCVYENCIIREWGADWVLKNKVNRISAKGDNLSILNSDQTIM